MKVHEAFIALLILSSIILKANHTNVLRVFFLFKAFKSIVEKEMPTKINLAFVSTDFLFTKLQLLSYPKSIFVTKCSRFYSELEICLNVFEFLVTLHLNIRGVNFRFPCLQTIYAV